MIKKLLSKKIWLAVIGVGILVIVFIIVGSVDNYNKQKEKEEIDRYTQEQLEIAGANQNSDDSLLMQMQPDLIKSYGKLPDGYIWNLDGTLLSLGDKSMSAEEVVYAYLNGLKSLDFSSVQKFSRDSVVVNTYENYFTELNKSTDYNDSFIRNIYRESLLSMQIDGIVNTSVFAENKQVFTVKVNMLDLTKKDFWLNDNCLLYTSPSPRDTR